MQNTESPQGLRVSDAQNVVVVPFSARHAEAWRALNEAWITKLFAMEEADRWLLDHPVEVILAPGGHIFIAERAGEAIGCVALIPLAGGGFKVAKMAVAESARGAGVGRRLMDACIQTAKAAGAPRLYLETNASLVPALALYRSAGFKTLPPRAAPDGRRDVWMELRLD